MKTVSAAEANRHFSKLLREVAGGETVLVTSHGRTVAKLVPAGDDDVERERRREAALREFMELGRRNRIGPIPKWTREELYEDEPYPDTFK
ncbi:type II toxin-antitoxin system Phd/YefM family antitoxin [Methyloraptor flagellatus]|jgi:prevent-host-death family protein|uniref:Antitoxin n=1 Tax=Methyloraptor flagellatus TaxID=3162530 RepID=A0AAU7X772_9HYPH